MRPVYTCALRYDVTACCTAPFRTGSPDGGEEGVLRDGRGIPFLQGTGIRGALRTWLMTHGTDSQRELLFGKNGILRVSDGLFREDTEEILRAVTIIDRISGSAHWGSSRLACQPRGSEFRFCLIWQGQEEQLEAAEETLDTLLSALHFGQIRLGGYNSFGFGRVELRGLCRAYRLRDPEDRNSWLSPEESWPEPMGGAACRPLRLSRPAGEDRVIFTVTGTVEKILVEESRQERADESQPFTENGEYLIPASTVKGALRSGAEGVVMAVGLPDASLVEELFGKEAGPGRDAKRGRLTFSDVKLVSAEKHSVYRIRINRFTGTMPGRQRKGLNPVQGILQDLEISGRMEGKGCMLLLFALRDLGLGLYQLGGKGAVGCGIPKTLEITADVPARGWVKLIFDGQQEFRLEDPAGIAEEWMNDWREYCDAEKQNLSQP